MTQARETVSFKPGEVILYPGPLGPRDRAYRVLSGLVRLEAVDEEGNALTLRLVPPGGYFGEEALFGLERGHFAEAVTEVVLETLPKEPSPEELKALAQHLAQALAPSPTAALSAWPPSASRTAWRRPFWSWPPRR
jgi:CRP-like cAMP-binding protein